MTRFYPRTVTIDQDKLPLIKNLATFDHLIFHRLVDSPVNDYYRFLLPFQVRNQCQQRLIVLMMNPSHADGNFPDPATDILLNHTYFGAKQVLQQYQYIDLINVIPLTPFTFLIRILLGSAEPMKIPMAYFASIYPKELTLIQLLTSKYKPTPNK